VLLFRQHRVVEGIRLAPEAAPPEAPPVPPSGDLPDRLLEWNVASCAVAAEVHPRNGHLAEIPQLIDRRGEVGEDPEVGLPEVSDPVVAVVGAAFELEVERVDRDLIAGEQEKGVEATPVESVDGATVKLNVLLGTSQSEYPAHAKARYGPIDC
jgi:hypothetical protein